MRDSEYFRTGVPYRLYQEARKSTCADRWHTYVDSIREHVSNTDDRKELFSDAQAECLRLRNLKHHKHMWFFSHGSLEIFERFIRNENCQRRFAEYLAYVHQPPLQAVAYNVRNNVSKLLERMHTDTKGYSLMPDPSPEDWFMIYYNCIIRISETYFFLPTENPQKGHHVELVPRPLTEPVSEKRLIRKFKEELAPEILNSSRFFSFLFMKGMISKNMTERILDEVIDSIPLKLDDIYWHHPRSWCLRDGFPAYMMGIARKRTWPIFTTAPQPTLVAYDACYECEMHLPDLPTVISKYFPDGYEWLEGLNASRHGRLPIGIKLHFTEQHKPQKISQMFHWGGFKIEQATGCMVMPPVGNIEALAEVIELIEKYGKLRIFENPGIQIQVCSVGRLNPRYAALLGICAYLGADTLVPYTEKNFSSSTHETGNRLVLYDAGGILKKSFEWWTRGESGNLVVRPFKDIGRTDVLAAFSLHDVEVINLVATLLLHAQQKGYWQDLGNDFVNDLEHILAKHDLLDVLDVSWVYDKTEKRLSGDPDGSEFFAKFKKLIDLAKRERMEALRYRTLGDQGGSRQGILFEIQNLLDQYRTELALLSPAEEKELP